MRGVRGVRGVAVQLYSSAIDRVEMSSGRYRVET